MSTDFFFFFRVPLEIESCSPDLYYHTIFDIRPLYVDFVQRMKGSGMFEVSKMDLNTDQ